MNRASPLVREALLAAAAAASLAALLAWLGPPGNDLAAHVYQRAVFLDDGYELWNNFWYGGRYSFITYSVIYYPLAALFGIQPLAVASIATAALAFAVVVGRQWGPLARWSSRSFAVVWAGLIISAAFPFALGFAFGLLALWALQAGKRWQFGVLAALTLLASPLAFLLLSIVLAGVALDLRERGRRLLVPALVIVGIGAAQVLLTRAFADGGRYPFPNWQLAAVITFCTLGVALTWRVERAQLLRWFFPALLIVCLFSYFVPSPLGENVARIRFVALPIAVLVFSIRGWRPMPVAAVALLLAAAWNLSPHAWSFERGRAEQPAAQAAYWQPAIDYLNENLTPSYRVEVVDTAGHWAAVHLPEAGIPLVRGWFRQDDFPAERGSVRAPQPGDLPELAPRPRREIRRSQRYAGPTTAPSTRQTSWREATRVCARLPGRIGSPSSPFQTRGRSSRGRRPPRSSTSARATSWSVSSGRGATGWPFGTRRTGARTRAASPKAVTACSCSRPDARGSSASSSGSVRSARSPLSSAPPGRPASRRAA